MPKRKDEEEAQWGEDSDIYLPDEALRSAFYNPTAHIVYRNGQIVVDEEKDPDQSLTIETSWDYIVAKIYVKLQDWAHGEAVPLMDKRGADSSDFEQFLKRFL